MGYNQRVHNMRCEDRYYTDQIEIYIDKNEQI